MTVFSKNFEVIQLLNSWININFTPKSTPRNDISPIDVFIPAGNTGLEPSKTLIFQQANIGTKIYKAQIEVLKRTKVLSVSQRVTLIHHTLFDLLKLTPFCSRMQIHAIYANGVFTTLEEIQNLTKSVLTGMRNLQYLSCGLDLYNELTGPYFIAKSLNTIQEMHNIIFDYKPENYQIQTQISNTQTAKNKIIDGNCDNDDFTLSDFFK